MENINIKDLFFQYFDWLFKLLASFGVEVPGYVKDNFTTTAPEADGE